MSIMWLRLLSRVNTGVGLNFRQGMHMTRMGIKLQRKFKESTFKLTQARRMCRPSLPASWR